MANCTPPFAYVDYILTTEMIDPADQEFVYAFDLLDAGIAPLVDQILVYVNDDLLDADQWEINTPGTVTVLLVADGGPRLAVGDRLRIQRDTYRCARYIDWNDNALINKSDLNLEGNQLFFLIQESLDLGYDAMRKSPSGLRWNARGLPVGAAAPAVLGDDLVTLNQAQDILAGGGTAQLGDVTCWSFEPDGVETEFELDGAPPTINPKKLIVTVDGVTQCSCVIGVGESTPSYPGGRTDIEINPGSVDGASYYTINDNGLAVLVFVTPPANGTELCVRMFSGTVSTLLLDGSVSTSQIINGAVTLAKLGMPTSEDVFPRVIIVDEFGDCTVRRPLTTDIEDFDAAVEAKSLSDFAVPSADLPMGTHKITGLTAGTASTDAVNKTQMDGRDAATLAAAQDYTDAALAAGGITASGVYTSQFTAFAYGVVQTRNIPAGYGGAMFNSVLINVSHATLTSVPMLWNISEWGLGTTKNFFPEGTTYGIAVTRTSTGFTATTFGANLVTWANYRLRFTMFFNI